MTITKESTGDLTATVKIAVGKQDYEEQVNKVLKDYQHKANIPGFRPGKVPFGMVQKMFGKAVIADELNKILSDSIARYIEEEKLEILGNPIANKEKNSPFDFENQEDFEFWFDLGFSPTITLNLDTLSKVERFVIKVEDSMIDRYIEDTRKRFGNPVHPDTAEADDTIDGEITETDSAGNLVSGGFSKRIFVTIPLLRKDSSRESLIGLKKEGKISIKPLEFFSDKDEALKVLSIPDDKFPGEDSTLTIEVKDIIRTEPADLNPDFFKKVYPLKDFQTIEDFRVQVAEEASASFSPETDKLFFRQVSDKLLNETTIQLPDEFLKRWLLEHKENKLTADQIEKEYPAFADSMKWNLIENKLFKDNGISVEEKDIRDYIKGYFIRQIPLNTDDPEAKMRFDSLVDTVMKNTEQVRKINDELYSNRLLDLFKSRINVEEKQVTFEEFAKIASSLETADHHHDHDHEHEHHHNH